MSTESNADCFKFVVCVVVFLIAFFVFLSLKSDISDIKTTLKIMEIKNTVYKTIKDQQTP